MFLENECIKSPVLTLARFFLQDPSIVVHNCQTIYRRADPYAGPLKANTLIVNSFDTSVDKEVQEIITCSYVPLLTVHIIFATKNTLSK